MTLAEWQKTLAVNLDSAFLGCKAVLPTMIKNKHGRVINFSSATGKQPLTHRAPYATSKMGVIGFTRTLAADVGRYNITVNAICPGPIRTAMLARRMQVTAELSGESVADMEKSINPMQRLLEPDEVADLAVFLASDSAKSITGQAYNISGGAIMH